VKFEKIGACQLDLTGKYMKVLSSYGQDLEQVRTMYEAERTSPATPRNLPPIAGRIAWARQLFRRLEAPMKVFQKYPDILKVRQRMRCVAKSSLRTLYKVSAFVCTESLYTLS